MYTPSVACALCIRVQSGHIIPGAEKTKTYLGAGTRMSRLAAARLSAYGTVRSINGRLFVSTTPVLLPLNVRGSSFPAAGKVKYLYYKPSAGTSGNGSQNLHVLATLAADSPKAGKQRQGESLEVPNAGQAEEEGRKRGRSIWRKEIVIPKLRCQKVQQGDWN
ncbi:hypothetical protein K432DRAFT_394079 [Lepidopterella palustris CBS 459.81]|uniref:Uncharacterized protein n=1 Tax=Lepidopterella palustris CBS 459.81 TaxID=1314670 RepID=A0A8E2E8N5_9PEZI|nr:hypothetical protein K432DRAFT_394079 [Lepidopterella palustris CBS 459.81]